MAAKNGKWENGFPDLNTIFLSNFMLQTTKKNIHVIVKELLIYGYNSGTLPHLLNFLENRRPYGGEGAHYA